MSSVRPPTRPPTDRRDRHCGVELSRSPRLRAAGLRGVRPVQPPAVVAGCVEPPGASGVAAQLRLSIFPASSRGSPMAAEHPRLWKLDPKEVTDLRSEIDQARCHRRRGRCDCRRRLRVVSAASSNGSAGANTGQTANAGPLAKGGSNARSGPAAGGVVGTVSSVSTSSFTLSTPADQNATVKTSSSTTYRKGTSSTSASVVTTGTPVLVLGTTNGTTITATQVVAQPVGGGSSTFSPSNVIGFNRGAPTTSKQDGQIPANYSEGSGTIVSGTAANQATSAALAAYPGGIVDRVVKLSNGEYEVHNIGVNWPHHIFVNPSFNVVGAD
jgi:hypothetical protein